MCSSCTSSVSISYVPMNTMAGPIRIKGGNPDGKPLTIKPKKLSDTPNHG